MIITREKIKEKLNDYVDSKLSLKEIFNWADKYYLNCDYSDWEEDESVSKEIIARISMADIDGFTKVEAKGLIQLLESEGTTVDIIKRIHQLAEKHFVKKD